MPWYFPWSDAIKKRACRYLLQRYLGQFLQQKLTLDQLTVDLYSGKGVVTEVMLDVELINETFESANLPFEIVDGFIGSVSVEIPWSALLSESTHVEITDLEVTLKPKQVAEKSVMLDSMWGSMTKSSMQLAEECWINDEERNKKSQSNQFEYSGLEKFAQAIDIVLTRIKVEFSNIIIRLEQVQDNSKTRAVALEVRISRVKYFDEAAGETTVGEEEVNYHPLPIANKCFHIEGLTVFSDVYCLKTMDTSSANSSTSISTTTNTENNELYFSTTEMATSKSEDSDQTPTDDSVNRHNGGNLVQIAVCHGVTEIRLKVKQNTEISGPKFELDGHTGVLHVLLWPKQLEMLRDLFGEMSTGRTYDSSFKTDMQKPMTDSDYTKIESELQRDFDARQNQTRGGNNIQLAMWDNVHANSEEEEFYPIGSRSSTIQSTAIIKKIPEQIVRNPMNHFPVQHQIAYRPGFLANRSSFVYGRSTDNSSTTTNSAKLRIASLFLTLVENNPEMSEYKPTFPFSELQQCSEEHFKNMADIDNWDLSDTLALRDKFARSVPQGHIWFGASIVLCEWMEKISPGSSVVSLRSSMGTFEAWEHMFDSFEPDQPAQTDNLYRLKTVPLCTELLTFPNRTHEDRFSAAPCVLIEFDSIEQNATNLLQRGSPVTSKAELTITLQPARTDVDITIIDRLTSLISSLSTPARKPEMMTRWSPAPNHSVDSSTTFLISLNCARLTAHLRFPVLDLRPPRDRSPWWTRSLHKESLVIELETFLAKTSFDGKASRRFDFQCESITGSMQNSPDDKSVPFLRAVMVVDEKLPKARQAEFGDRPRMSVFMQPPAANVFSADILIDPNEHPQPPGSLENIFDTTENEPALFSVQRNMVDHEEINCDVPSSANETRKFKDNVIKNAQLVLEATIPSVTAFIFEKAMLEVLYNRINTDLLLWERSGTKSHADVVPLSAAHMGIDEALMPSMGTDLRTNTFEMCRSMAADGSDSMSDTSEDEYYSRETTRARASKLKNIGLLNHRAKIPSEVCVVLNIGKAGIGAKVQNLVENPSSADEIWIELADVNIFSVSGYRGQPEIRYSAISIQKLELGYGDYIEPVIPKSEQVLSMLTVPAHLLPLAQPVNENFVIPNASTNDGKSEPQAMLNLAISIHVDTFRNLKDIKVALEFNAVKLFHRVTLPEDFWLTQVIDYVNLRDFPVLGYNSPTIITEFHLNICSSMVEYKPKYLPLLRAVVTLDKVNVSSTIVAESPQSLLRVITQDLRVHLSKKTQPSALKDDYVCVVDVPFVEFQIKLTDGKNPRFPRFDFRASNNCCYVRTCSDSCRELSDLIVYLANYGDLNDDYKTSRSESCASQNPPSERSPPNEENVSDEMMDAMKESPPRKESLPKTTSSMATSMYNAPMAATISTDMKLSDLISEVDDEDFCIIEEDLGVGIPLKSGEPSIKFLTTEPIRILDNHFDLPLAVSDQLKAPDNYPLPVIRLALKEMSIIWCLYGGHDFDDSPAVAAPRKFGSHHRLQSAPAKLGEARSSSLKPEKAEHSSCSPSWLRQGGVGRDHAVLMEIHLNKVKFQHEQYAFDGKTSQAARQVLFIQDFEIRDRMATSEINKFLYQYVSTSLPKQSHASMFSVRALHERPDPSLPMQECTLKISLQPLRLNVDQESLFFLSDFFAQVSGSTKPGVPATTEKADLVNINQHITSDDKSADQFPMRTRRLESLEEEDGMGLQDPLIHFDDAPMTHPVETKITEAIEFPNLDTNVPVFFKSVTFSPEVPIRLDYHGKYVDMERGGALAGLLVGLAQLNCSLLRLKRVTNRQGISGFDRLLLHLLNEWVADIRKTQLANLLGGVGPMHCLVQLVQGIRDLFWLPVEQYRKDGRIVRGVQRGASAFTTSTLIATIELTNRIVQTVQVAAESAYDVISPGPSFRRRNRLRKKSEKSTRSQPGDIREGVVNAIGVLRDGFNDTAREIVDAVSEEHEHKGVTGAVGGALRQIGPAIVKPLILASQATSSVLGGLRNQLQPDYRQDELEKWRTEDDVKQIKPHNVNR